MSRSHGLRLVIDNSHRFFAKKHRSDGDAAYLTLSENPVMKPFWEFAVATPIADGAHPDAEQFCSYCSTAESVNDGIDRIQDNSVHTPCYSCEMNAVNHRISESVQNRNFRRVAGMLRDIPSDALTHAALRLRAARTALGKTQREACRAAGVEPNTWNQWERARYLPDVLAMSRFSDLYGITLDWVYRGRADTMSPDRAEKIIECYNALLKDKVA